MSIASLNYNELKCTVLSLNDNHFSLELTIKGHLRHRIKKINKNCDFLSYNSLTTILSFLFSPQNTKEKKSNCNFFLAIAS